MLGSTIARVLLDADLINQDELQIARKESKRSGISLEQALVSAGFISPSDLRDIKGKHTGKATISLIDVNPCASVLRLIPAQQARKYTVFPLQINTQKSRLTLAMENAHDVIAIDAISTMHANKFQLDIRLASRTEILQAIDRCYGGEESIEKIIKRLDAEITQEPAGVEVKPSVTCIQLIDELLAEAVRFGASDIHFEPESGFLRLRYRIDGVLKQIRVIHIEYWSAMSIRIKVLSNLNIAESRGAQDGRFSQLINGTKMDFRVSSFPSVSGEAIVIRLLDSGAKRFELSEMGLSQQLVLRLRRIARQPSGMIIISGPTGSGKSTTLYALLNTIRCEEINIVTMEDPVEYSLPMVRQCSLNSAIKLDFASGVRSILRQDPDVILVGETRDLATAEMVIRAALTGHLVLTTLHCQSALSVLSRLSDLGVRLSYLADNVQALLAQRLVRKLCVHCKQREEPPKELKSSLSAEATIYRAVGCALCANTGYSGRQAIIELYEPSRRVHDLLAAGEKIGKIVRTVSEEGHPPLIDSGLAYLESGVTSVQELARAISVDFMAYADVH